MNKSHSTSPRGAAAVVVLHVALLLLVLGQVVFLASRNHLRIDLTADKAWSLSGSTLKILGGLQDRLVMECYFSPKEVLPAQLRDARTVLDNLLDELVQVGNGHVVVQRFDPNSDKMIADKARRLGIKPAELPTRTSSSLQVNVAWQGIRLIAGGQKQKILEQIGSNSSSQLEAAITMAVREVLTKERHKLGFMEWPMDPPPGQQQPGAGPAWSYLRSIPDIAKRYEFVNVKDAEGVLVPDDIDTLFLFRPKNLSDRDKYVVDQFLMRGGSLVVFADVADYQIGQYRTFNRVQGFNLDVPGSKEKWLDQLLSYGVQIKEKILADGAPEAMNGQPGEYMCALRPAGMQMMQVPVQYPYFFHPLSFDWRDRADQLATNPRTGVLDQELADQYRKNLHPGIDSDDFLFAAFKKLGRGPGFYWPCWTDLRRKGGEADLPPGVTGRVLLWSTPNVLVEEPPQDLNPLRGQDAQQQNASYMQFAQALKEKFLALPEVKQQAPLMVDLHGHFHSYFDGKERPKRASELKEEAAKKAAEEAGKDPLKEPVKEQPDQPEQPKKGGPRPDAQGPDRQEPQKQEPPKQEPPPQAPIGPMPAPKQDDEAAKAPKIEEPAPLTECQKDGRIVVIGDADFVRDDLARGDYQQRGGPVSQRAAVPFFYQLLDWLAQDADLAELQSRVPVARSLQLVTEQTGEAPAEFERRRDQQKLRLQLLNILLPILVLGGIGVVVFVARRAQKRTFLSRHDQLSEQA